MLRAAHACLERGALSVRAVATHGLFGPGSDALLSDGALERILVTDSLPSAARAAGPKVRIVRVGPMLGQAIGRLHLGEPLGDLAALED